MNLASIDQWRHVLLEAPSCEALRAELPEFLKLTAHRFIATVPTSIAAEERLQLDQWYASSSGQDSLAKFADRLWDQMAAYTRHSMPGHDARHAIYKTPAMALEYMAGEWVVGWERVGVLGALLHDHGRWAEERVYGGPSESVLHARLSFLLGRELLDDFDMPERVKQHILLSAIRHSSGATPQDPMPLKLTVAADRDQLYGPEIVIRLLHYPVGLQNEGASLYGEKPGSAVLDQLMRFVSTRLPGPLFSMGENTHALWSVLTNFVLMCEDEASSKKRFDRFVVKAHNAFGADSSGALLDWRSAWEHAQSLMPAAADPVDALSRLLQAPHTAPSLRYRIDAIDKLSHLPEAAADRLGAALTYAELERQREDLRQKTELIAIHEASIGSDADALVEKLSGLLLADWNGPQPSAPRLGIS